MNAIYICDDEPEWLRRIEKCITGYQLKSDWALELSGQAATPEQLLALLEAQKPVAGIYFLDIDFKGQMDGLALGAKIRKIDPDATLVFVTTHEELVMETFRHRLLALDYIVKNHPDLDGQIQAVLSALENCCFSRNATIQEKLCIKTGDGYHFVAKNEIYYIESQTGAHKTAIHTPTQILSIPRPLSELANELGEGFLLCRKGCLVNTTHIKEVQWKSLSLVLLNNETISCSSRCWSKVLKYVKQHL